MLEKIPEDIRLYETASFSRRIAEASRMMAANANLIEIPQGAGLILVRENTPEALEKRKARKILYPTYVRDEKYYVCKR